MKNITLLTFFLTLLFAQHEIEGRWHLVGYEDNVMYQFEDNYRYSIYSLDGTFGGLEDAGGSPNPYTIVEDIITLDLFFGIIVNYQMNFMCEGQVVEFTDITTGALHSTLFREGYDYIDNDCEECFDFTGLDFGLCTMVLGIGYVDGECASVSGCDWTINGIDYSDLSFDDMEECEEACMIDYQIDLGDINFDEDINVLDVVLLVSFILGNPTNEEEYSAADINVDSLLNILDVVLLIDIILNPQLPIECHIVPEIGPCEGICPTFYFNQNTNQCEEFISGCCGVEAFNSMQSCIDFCQ